MIDTGREAVPVSPRSKKGARTRARLVEAATQVFAEHGLLDTRIADIAERAGVSYGAFYHYFESKEALFREIARQVDTRINAPVGEIILASGSGASPQARLRQAIGQHFETYRSHAELLGAVEQAARVDEHVRADREAQQQITRAQVADSIGLLQRRGLADPALDPVVAAAALGSMVDGFAEVWLADGGIECAFATGVETVSRLFINALGLDSPERGVESGPPAAL
jgi:AcrR family transcriptional regulator